MGNEMGYPAISRGWVHGELGITVNPNEGAVNKLIGQAGSVKNGDVRSAIIYGLTDSDEFAGGYVREAGSGADFKVHSGAGLDSPIVAQIEHKPVGAPEHWAKANLADLENDKYCTVDQSWYSELLAIQELVDAKEYLFSDWPADIYNPWTCNYKDGKKSWKSIPGAMGHFRLPQVLVYATRLDLPCALINDSEVHSTANDLYLSRRSQEFITLRDDAYPIHSTADVLNRIAERLDVRAVDDETRKIVQTAVGYLWMRGPYEIDLEITEEASALVPSEFHEAGRASSEQWVSWGERPSASI